MGMLTLEGPVRSTLFTVDEDFDADPLRRLMRQLFTQVMESGEEVLEAGTSLTQVCHLLHLARSLRARTIVEVGFNIGYSCLAFLEASPVTKVISFELDDRPCVRVANAFIDQHYPGRHSMVFGDSQETLPLYVADADTDPADLIFIDGSHQYDVVAKDIRNGSDLAGDAGIVVLDDLTPWYPWGTGPTRAWREAIEDGIVSPLEYLVDGAPGASVEGPADRCWAVGRYVHADRTPRRA
jgi:predicted O-methyltransferase YrrM